MKNNKNNTNTHESKASQLAAKAKRIKLGIDVHADSYRVVRQIDNASPQPAQRFTPEGFLVWAQKQLDLAEEVHSCYEAGPFGYNLHRKLAEMGIRNVVVRPQNWDEYNKGVKTDKVDALALATRLAMYVDGNSRALAVVRVPTPEEELARSETRLREQLVKERRRLEAMGRSQLLYFGYRVKGHWWQPAKWERLSQKVEPKILAMLSRLRDMLLKIHEEVLSVTREIEKEATQQPIGVGALTSEVLEREVLDWSRFSNRRQVASMTGMCPGVRASGASSQSGSITKHGNRRLRTALVELAWRCVRFQPQYPPIQKWGKVLSDVQATGAAKKKAIVAVGRQLAIDLWRLNTGRATAEELGLRIG